MWSVCVLSLQSIDFILSVIKTEGYFHHFSFEPSFASEIAFFVLEKWQKSSFFEKKKSELGWAS